MKFASRFVLALTLPSVSAFQSLKPIFVRKTSLAGTPGMDLSGNTWKPDSETMGSTDTGDFFPDDYENEVGFMDGMMGSQALLNKDRSGPELPGMENLGADAIMMGGIEQAEGIPADMEFIPSSVPDGEFQMNVASQSGGQGKFC
jgi:hypothetical protein